MHSPKDAAMNPTPRTTRLVAAIAAVAVTLTLLQSVFTLFGSVPATQLAKAQAAAVTVVAAR